MDAVDGGEMRRGEMRREPGLVCEAMGGETEVADASEEPGEERGPAVIIEGGVDAVGSVREGARARAAEASSAEMLPRQGPGMVGWAKPPAMERRRVERIVA